MGIRSICHYCFPCWVNSEEEEADEISRKPVNDPQAASDCFRQGEKYLFSLQDLDIESASTTNTMKLALEKFEESKGFGGVKASTVLGIFHECAISMDKPDYRKAYKYYEDAADEGEGLAKALIASMPFRVECGTIPGDYKHRKQLLKEVTSQAFISSSQDPLKWLKEAADRYRLGEAMYLLGSCIEHGVGFRKPDPNTAFRLYLEASKGGIKTARRMLAKCYLLGNGVEKDVLAGKYWLIKAVKDNNDPEAMAILAMNYENGVFPAEENDYQEFTDIKHTELQKHAPPSKYLNVKDSINTAGSFEDEEQRDEEDSLEHVKWNSGPGAEVVQKADRVKVNRNERRDYRECHYWAKRSAEIGCAAGLYQLARCYEVGIGVAIDLQQCVSLYKSAIDAGYAPAQFSMACFYCSGCVVEKRDTKKAHELLNEAAESGYTPAMISLATLYTLESKTHTRVVEAAPTNRFRESLTTSLIKLRDPKLTTLMVYDEDLQKSMVWWRRAAKRGSRQAQYELALCFRDGRGVEVDIAKALYWMRVAAEAGLPEAQLELGVLLIQDVPAKGPLSNFEHDNESFYWILRAAKNGLPEAQIELGQLFIEGRYVHRNASTSFYWFKRAAKAGHPYAQYRVGTMLLDGEVANGCVGPQGTQAEAVKWLKLASEQGWADSDKLLPVALGMANEESFKTYRKDGDYIY